MKRAVFLTSILLLPWALFTLVSGEEVEVTGKVRLVGNMPFPQLVITDSEDQDWYIDEGDKQILAGLEQQTVKVRGTVELADMILANNKYIGTRRILKRITLLNRRPVH